jgi:hypothetical protein
MLENPSLEDLEARVAQVHPVDSPAYQSLIERVQELVQLGHRVVPNDPDLLSVTVEAVELVGTPPYTEAVVTVCEVTNRKEVTVTSPTSEVPAPPGTPSVDVARYDEPVRLADNGWLTYRVPREGTLFVQGETTCPPA